MNQVRWSDSALCWLGLSVVVLLADQWTKHVALSHLDYGVPVAVLPHLNWTLVYNYGAAFSLLADGSGWQRWFFILLAIVISVVMLAWMRRLPRAAWLDAVPLALIVAGAIGNVIDRLRYGYVVDFIQVCYDQWSWPVFNVADSAISVGAVWLALVSLRTAADTRPNA